MFTWILFLLAFKISNYIDGIENVKLLSNEDNKSMEFLIESPNIYIFFKDLYNMTIKINGLSLNQNQNGYLIPEDSKVNIIMNELDYNKYMIGFFDGDGCDYILFAANEKFSFPSINSNMNICEYKLRNKTSENQKKTILDEFYHFQYDYNNNEYFNNEKIIFIKANGNSTNDSSSCDSLELKQRNKTMIWANFIFVFIGMILYLSLSCASNVYCCKSTCPCSENKCEGCFKSEEVDNYFFSKTLLEFGDIIKGRISTDENTNTE